MAKKEKPPSRDELLHFFQNLGKGSKEKARFNENEDEDLDLPAEEFVELIRDLKVRAYSDIIKSRTVWSYFLLGVLFLIVIAELVMVFGVGLDKLHYEDEWFVRIMVIGGFSTVIAVPNVVVKFLFDKENLPRE